MGTSTRQTRLGILLGGGPAPGGAFRVAHVPKTIDNDLPLPVDMPTFGLETARHVGTELTPCPA